MNLPAPFGLSLGMKLEDFSELKLAEIAPFKYRLDNPPKPHPAFEFYILQISPENGLSWIKAIGQDIPTNGFGTSINSAFLEMEGKLKKTYGNCDRTDLLLQGSIWNEPQDWMMGLVKGERLLASHWEVKTGAKLTEAIESVFLVASARETDCGYIAIEYALKNNSAASEEIASSQDDAL
ncbi:hypothetical protein [Hydrogenophaga atypica]|uniref:Uncharacterized protein n=1 Tax=Hydrogenophaga atypica TaxID=249409 RepID=A0ABW2QLH8_9BURK